VAIGVLLGFLGALGLVVAGLAVELSSIDQGTAFEILALGAALGLHGSTELAMRSLAALWSAAVGACFAPVALAALFGEALRLREPVWYAGASGALAAASPTVARAVLDAPATQAGTVAEGRLTLLLFLAGAGGGFVYWLAAGRRAAAGERAT
jgi:hypothetical protein